MSVTRSQRKRARDSVAPYYSDPNDAYYRQRVAVSGGTARSGNPDSDDYPSLMKIFNDPVHGTIEVSEACSAIIDTPEFQRLRYLKQLGFCYFVYPGASHNRFEHSIGVYHLAGKMARSLQSRQTELNITKIDILCVEIAGLCHDLGHGPFSHMFDGKFIPKITGNTDWTHEKASLQMFDYLVEKHKMMEEDGILTKSGLCPNDIVFIKELIDGPLNGGKEKWPYRGRLEDKAFLYEIVSNKHTGIDVDKWDYFARDCHHLGVVNSFDHTRYMKSIKVLMHDGRRHICSRDKEMFNLYQMFYTRYTLHRKAYQHQAAVACELMALDAFLKANDFLKIPCSDGTQVRLSESIKDMSAYTYVTDNILWEIYSSNEAELKPAKEIITRLFERKLYKKLTDSSVGKEFQRQLNEYGTGRVMNGLRDELIQLLESHGRPEGGNLFHLQFVSMDFGKKDKDPLHAMRYYSKYNQEKAEEGDTTGMLLPERFQENRISIYSTDSSKEVCDILKECFQKLCENRKIGQRSEEGADRTQE